VIRAGTIVMALAFVTVNLVSIRGCPFGQGMAGIPDGARLSTSLQLNATKKSVSVPVARCGQLGGPGCASQTAVTREYMYRYHQYMYYLK